MAILSGDDYLAAAPQAIQFTKTGARTTVAQGWFSTFDVAGAPGAGTLAGTSATPGVVPTDAIAGYPVINAFGGGALGYITGVRYSSSVACRIRIYDRLYVAGTFAFNASAAITSAPSYVGRLPNSDYSGLEIWVEAVTAFTGNQTFNVTYTNQAGTGSRTTGAVGIGAAPTVGRCWQLPLQAGDTGVQALTNVVGGTGSAGTANVMVLRRLWEGRVNFAGYGDTHDLFNAMMPQIYADSALYVMVCADSTALGIPDLTIDVRNK